MDKSVAEKSKKCFNDFNVMVMKQERKEVN